MEVHMTFEEYKRRCVESYTQFKDCTWKEWPYSNMYNVCRVREIDVTSYICGGETCIVAKLFDDKPRVSIGIEPHDQNKIFKLWPYGGGCDKGVIDEFIRRVLNIDNVPDNDVKGNVILAKAIMSWIDELSNEVKNRTLEDRERKERKALEEKLARDRAVFESIG